MTTVRKSHCLRETLADDEFASQIFPSWPTGDVESSTASTPLIMQSELTGLLSLCKLEVSFFSPSSIVLSADSCV